MNKTTTVITLSKEPAIRPVPWHCEYLNHVSSFSTMKEQVAQTIKAISKVKTEFFTLHDYDDPMPLRIPEPTKGLVYGDFLTEEKGLVIRRKANDWTESEHIRNPYMIHRAVCRTEAVLKVHEHLPDLDLQFELIYYFFTAAVFGAEYDKNYDSIWSKKESGMHKVAATRFDQAYGWLKHNRVQVVQNILQDISKR